MSFKKVDPKQSFPKLEEEVLNFWNKEKIFEKSVEEKSKNKTFSFYDGPPFATGLPHYGHLLAGFIKDVIPRYKTMQGYRVERVWGWDTHGLPIENLVEQELGFKAKKDIENYGVDKFNEKCRSKVLHYAEEWKKIVSRTGRWVDMENAYVTMEPEYMESVWWVFKKLYNKSLIKEDYKVMSYCPRCATPLSNFELGLNYKDTEDSSIFIKFPLKDEKDTYFLVWTTTPWTLPGNVALAVGKTINYVKVKQGNDSLILAEDRISVLKDKFEIVDKFKGKDLESKSYKNLYEIKKWLPEFKEKDSDYKVHLADFVSTEDGTGIVHIAPPFGEDDMKLGQRKSLTRDHGGYIDSQGKIIKGSGIPGEGKLIAEANEEIIDSLQERKLLYKNEILTHSYPHCYRCETPLIYKALKSLFVDVQENKKKLLEINNKQIKWIPESIGKGRFHKILEGAPDWNISRNRFWGTPIPIWKCKTCDVDIVFGSIAELEKASGKKIGDIHLHKIQNIKVPCKCGGEATITGEVLDCWFESGSMPYASIHYPFDNKEKFSRDFPADFIAEGVDQTRGWFNTLLILSTDLFGDTAFKRVVVNGIVLAENGQKMAKRLKNYPDPMNIVHKYGADALRFYLISSPAVKAGDLRFSEKGVDEVVKKLILTLWNSYSFFVTYANIDKFEAKGISNKPKNILDQWILSEVENLNAEVTKFMDGYELDKSTRRFGLFLDNLSNWYIRRSRRRFWKSGDDNDKKEAYETLYYILGKFVKLLAPFMPYLSEEIYKNLTGEESVHLTEWPEAKKEYINNNLMKEIKKVRNTINLALANRAKEGIKVREPLAAVSSGYAYTKKYTDSYGLFIKEEVNVKDIIKGKEGDLRRVTPKYSGESLKQEGLARELVRQIQQMRKEANFNVEDRIETYYQTEDKELSEAIEKFAENKDYSIKKETLSEKLVAEKSLKTEYQKDLLINKKKAWIGLLRK